MSLIEQAAQRLQQLREAGVEIPDVDGLAGSVSTPGTQTAAVKPATPPTNTSKLVTLDLDGLMAKGIVTPNAPRSVIADQFRVVKRPLITNAMNRGDAAVQHSNLIMVTSALSGEGKSFTSINLAMSIAAELDHTVMLVDADVARPSILKVLGLDPAPGLLEVLEGKADLAGTLLRTNVDKLTILPSGTPHPKATELLASEAMAALLEDIATRYSDRIVIFDSPPLLLTTESRVLASHMGQIVVVVQAGRTLQADVQNALATIESCPIRLMLLNKARAIGKDAYGYGYGYGYGEYGYGYGHGYGYGYGYGDAAASASKA
ncbi:MAG TPA: XrtA-associated tyrosine autokinase [Rubrivivax sp.]|nr:XrtA-associated tyrosine autokinase [Rubrivivax sp.]